MDEPFSGMQDPSKRAERYEKMAEEFAELAKDASSPFLRAYYQRIAEQYRTHAEGEDRTVEQEAAAIRERKGT
jgi:predicted ArsR family transcriptional regulator